MQCAHARTNRVWRSSEDLCKWACRERQFVAEKDNYTGRERTNDCAGRVMDNNIARQP